MADRARRGPGAAAEAGRLRARLVEHLRAGGMVRTDAVAAAFSEVPREQFVAGVLAEQGLEAVYRDEAHVIKKDREGRPLSSSSQPGIMAQMLDRLDLRLGHRVLEIGAGSGYNAALMSRLVGPSGRITSVDIDSQIAGDARRALEAGDFAARVVVGDGRRGWSNDSPFDRIIVTASVGEVPVAWLEQLVEGGLLEFPLRVDSASTALQVIPVLRRAGGVLRTVAMGWGGFMPVHGGGGGWELLPPALSAGRFGGGGSGAAGGGACGGLGAGEERRSLIQIDGPGLARVSDAGARTLLAEVLRGAGSPLVTGSTELGTGRPPLVIVYVLLRIPERRRVWVTTRERVGVGVLDGGGRGLALLSVPNPWLAARRREGVPRVRAGRRVRWRLDAYGAHGPALDELHGLLSDWDALRREGRTDLEITARPAGERLALLFQWRRAGAEA
jgi:protein-L-isoaspartate(D-aspartate) O-methyltransferase